MDMVIVRNKYILFDLKMIKRAHIVYCTCAIFSDVHGTKESLLLTRSLASYLCNCSNKDMGRHFFFCSHCPLCDNDLMYTIKGIEIINPYHFNNIYTGCMLVELGV